MEECVICKAHMHVQAFDDSAVEGSDKDCFRLSCKHAFHTQCLVQSLRTVGKNCPVCRDSGTASAAATESNNVLTISISLDEEESFEDNEQQEVDMFAARLLHSLNSSNVVVRAAKHALNDSIKAYNVFRDKLRQERRQRIAAAMREFRQRRFKDFCAAKERVKQSLDTYHDKVRTELQMSLDVFEFSNVREVLKQQSNVLYSVRRQDPMRSTFWHA